MALLGEGIDSRMLVRHKHSSDKQVQIYKGNRDLISRLGRTLLRSNIARLEQISRSEGLGSLTDPRADLLRTLMPEIEEADVINLHKTEHFVDFPALLRDLPSNKPIVLTVHDISPATGGCDYPGRCNRFADQCGKCPILKSSSQHDYSSQIFELRRDAYATRDRRHFALAANSHWTAEMVNKSALTSKFRVEVIHYGIDQSIYFPKGREEARAALGIGLDEEVLFFAAHDVSLPHKGGVLLAEALASIAVNRPLRLLTMGSGHFKAPPQFRHMHFGKVESDELQALLYRSADVFVIPSLEEAFGQTALEAVACGTVVAGFQVGGIVDIVKNGLNGVLVESGNSKALGDAIANLLHDKSMKQRWQSSCTEWVGERFSYKKSASDSIALYQSLMK